MSFIKDTFFGGSEKRAAKKQVEASQEGQRLLSANIDRARDEAIPLFDQAKADITGGFQQARDIFAETLPQQAGLFQAGNVQAQNTLIGGLQQQQNALLGNAPVDLSGLQPSSVPLQGRLQPPAQQTASQGVLNPLAGQQFHGPLQQDPQSQQAQAPQVRGSILSAIQAGQLTFADLTPAQRQQVNDEIELSQGVGTR